MNIRTAKITDAKELLAIYTPYVLETAITFEYEVPEVSEFADGITKTLNRYPYLVAEESGEILGYAYASAYKSRAAYDWSVEVTVYVKQNIHARGVGTKLYQVLEKELEKQNIVNLTACITAGNEKSEAFHEKLGYQKVASFPHIGYKFNDWHDVVWMQKSLRAPEKNIPPFRPFEK